MSSNICVSWYMDIGVWFLTCLCSYLTVQVWCFLNIQEETVSQFRKTEEKTVAVGYKLDMVFQLIRMGLFYMDHDLIKRNLEKAQR